jgi:hypothetical protein
MTARQEAEAILQFGEDLGKLLTGLDRLFLRFSDHAKDRWNQLEHVEHLDDIEAAIRALGERLCVECDAGEEAEDRRRDNAIEPDFRRLGQ